jgi:hypothetical protein
MVEIRGFQGGEDSRRGLLGCDAVQRCGRIQTFQRPIVPLKRWYPTTSLYGVTTQKISV